VDFVVDDSVEDSSTVLLIQLEEETVGQGILALDTRKGPGPDGVFPLILKKIVLVVNKPLAVLFNLLSGGFSMRVEGVVCCSFVQEW
jgi:hypothetical protein